MINDVPTIFEVVTGNAKQSKEQSSGHNNSNSKSKSNSKVGDSGYMLDDRSKAFFISDCLAIFVLTIRSFVADETERVTVEGGSEDDDSTTT